MKEVELMMMGRFYGVIFAHKYFIIVVLFIQSIQQLAPYEVKELLVQVLQDDDTRYTICSSLHVRCSLFQHVYQHTAGLP